ncbi:MAG: PTS lactose/cellobiose transporter subunit IIA [Tissierellaceae bacterium]
MELELIIMNIINNSGESRSLSMEAIAHAKSYRFKEASDLIKQANNKLSQAHRSQTELIQGEARGEEKNLSLLLVHAQDHLMNAITIRDMAIEFIDVYKSRLNKEEN